MNFQEHQSTPYNTFNVNQPNQLDSAPKTTDLYGAARTAFIQKVYTILTIQLIVTVFMTALSMLSQAYFAFQVQNFWLLYVCIAVTIMIQIYIFCCGGARQYPGNMMTLAVFTFCQGYLVSFIASVTGYEQGNSIVFLAAFMTMVVFACTAYACYTKQDYTTSSLVVVILAVILFILFIVTLFTSSPFIYNLYCGVRVLLFSIYLIIDTQMIMGGKTIQLTVDEYALAALLLYIDIIQIFLYILQLLSNNNRN